MSDPIKHECGVALIRLRQPLSYFREKYGTPTWGLDKLQLLMIKQRNRGQDGGGIAGVKTGMPVGAQYICRKRSPSADPSEEIFGEIHEQMAARSDAAEIETLSDRELKSRYEFLCDAYVGHLRYGTHGENSLATCHPYVRHSNWPMRSLVMCGNFNLTNADEIFAKLVSYGLRPVGVSDTLTLMEKIGHFLDVEHRRLQELVVAEEPALDGPTMTSRIGAMLDIAAVLRRASKDWDGGYVLAGLIGNGDSFVCRDPHGIRPAFYLATDEVVAVASERAALTTVFNVDPDDVRAIQPGHVLSVRADHTWDERPFVEDREIRRCSFERIYFSRGNDASIYQERKALGRNLARVALDATKANIANTVFSFIPNTAEIAFLGLVEEVERIVRTEAAADVCSALDAGTLTADAIKELAMLRVRVEKACHKDQKVRTFITQDGHRGDLVSHVYDITRHSVTPDDTLVVLDDSIVRGTTLRDSIVTMLSRLQPKRIVVLSSAPPICYPDCYGIDMSELGKFVAFEAAIAVRRDRNEQHIIDEVYSACCEQATAGKPMVNHVARIYADITHEALSAKISELLRPKNVDWSGDLQIIYQTIEGLHAALPEHRGDWYFTGEYPTEGGYRVVNTAFINFYEHKSGRSY